MVVIVVFCRHAFSRAVDERFLAQANLFIAKTTQLASVVSPPPLYNK